MDILLICCATLLIILGIVGSFLPILPGPITGWFGFLLLRFTDSITIETSFLVVTFIVAALIWVLDYIIPALGTKRFGGTKAGVIGTTIGLIVGLIAPIPGGIIVGAFLGAFIGELINDNNTKKALRAAFGSFLGFITSVFLKFCIATVFLALFISILWKHKSIFI